MYSQGDAIDPQGDQIDRTPTGRVASHLFKHGQHEEAEDGGDLGDVEDIQVVMEDRVKWPEVEDGPNHACSHHELDKKEEVDSPVEEIVTVVNLNYKYRVLYILI